jgi:hypothetical protein
MSNVTRLLRFRETQHVTVELPICQQDEYDCAMAGVLAEKWSLVPQHGRFP